MFTETNGGGFQEIFVAGRLFVFGTHVACVWERPRNNSKDILHENNELHLDSPRITSMSDFGN